MLRSVAGRGLGACSSVGLAGLEYGVFCGLCQGPRSPGYCLRLGAWLALPRDCCVTFPWVVPPQSTANYGWRYWLEWVVVIRSQYVSLVRRRGRGSEALVAWSLSLSLSPSLCLRPLFSLRLCVFLPDSCQTGAPAVPCFARRVSKLSAARDGSS